MKFSIYALIICFLLFFGVYLVNLCIEKVTYEQVILEDTGIKQTNLYPTGYMFLADKQRDSYDIESFVYLLQNSNYDELKSLQTSLLVIDPENGDGELQFTNEQIKDLHSNKKYVIAYIDIGEAENWRSYYKNMPKDIIGIENPDWEDCFYVAFWQPYWKQLTYSRIANYLDNGYDGVYLDLIDVYEYWQEQGVKDAKQKAIDFVKDISVKVKAKNSNLLVIPQNALELLKENDYINYIDGIGAESTFYDTDKSASWSKWDLEYLDYAISKGRFVLSIDYSKKLNNRCNFVNKAKAHKFVPFVGPKDLDLFVHFSCPEIGYSQ
ncbi:MAG: hypothetical protein COT14_02735 [Candidatus Diapherotrites archaeon CG08_land_8_20_14_0_20_30_16]|nr:MAG: hypothetical protein COT14_02735 [Candidatus Diapherotrites archaeon CG08_land_8_20_14_0_20_30_16]